MSGNIHKRPKGAARILTAVVAGVLALSLAGCAAFDSWVGDVKGELTGNAFTSFRAGMPGISMPGGTAPSFRSKSSFIIRA